MNRSRLFSVFASAVFFIGIVFCGMSACVNAIDDDACDVDVDVDVDGFTVCDGD